MRLIDHSFDRPQENILFDDVLLHLSETKKMGEVLRFWESSIPFIVLGRISKAQEDLNYQTIRDDGIAVLRRSSGGGTVVQGPGCLNYSLILSKTANPVVADIRKSYQFILGRTVESLQKLGVKASFFPISDIALTDGQKKFSGNAQRRGKEFILHHGTILYDFDLKLIPRYLNMPKDIPEYRQARSHESFVVNISRDASEIKRTLSETWGVASPQPSLTEEQKTTLQKYLETKHIPVEIN